MFKCGTTDNSSSFGAVLAKAMDSYWLQKTASFDDLFDEVDLVPTVHGLVVNEALDFVGIVMDAPATAISLPDFNSFRSFSNSVAQISTFHLRRLIWDLATVLHFYEARNIVHYGIFADNILYSCDRSTFHIGTILDFLLYSVILIFHISWLFFG